METNLEYFPSSANCFRNGSQFFITTIVTEWLNDKHVVFGELADSSSKSVVKAIEATGSPSGKILFKKQPTVVDCGELKETEVENEGKKQKEGE